MTTIHRGTILILVFFVSCQCQAFARTWTDATGKFSVEAEFVSTDGEQVTLKKSDGSTITLPITKLSAADQEHVAALTHQDSSAA